LGIGTSALKIEGAGVRRLSRVHGLHVKEDVAETAGHLNPGSAIDQEHDADKIGGWRNFQGRWFYRGMR
jgi:hypothetical protein